MKYCVFCIKIAVFFVLLYTMCTIYNTAYSYSAQDNDYILHMQVNTEDNQEYNLVSPVHPLASQNQSSSSPAPKISTIKPGMTSKPRQTIEIGFPDAPKSSGNFRFSISDDLISFGPLSPTDFITRNLTLTISGDQSYKYSVTAYENHELQDSGGDFIPNTRCDDGDCDEETSGLWQNTLTFGFGYRCDSIQGNDCDPAFANKDSFKNFGFGTNNNGSSILLGNIENGKSAQILYRVNVPGTQHPGIYQNTLTYLAIPMY